MLRLTVSTEEYLMIGEDIKLVFLGGTGKHLRIMVDAPKDRNIVRSTVLERSITDPEERAKLPKYYAEEEHPEKYVNKDSGKAKPGTAKAGKAKPGTAKPGTENFGKGDFFVEKAGSERVDPAGNDAGTKEDQGEIRNSAPKGKEPRALKNHRIFIAHGNVKSGN